MRGGGGGGGEEEAMGEEELMEVLGLGDIFGFDRKSTAMNGGLVMDTELSNICQPSSISSCSSSVTSTATTSQMLCFGNISQKSSDSSSLSSLSSSPPSTTTATTKTSCARNSKKVESGGGGRRNTVSGGANAGSSSKKPRTGASASSGGLKVRRERLGDRIMALQQLVSPFGKSDTASVLHEALGYIRFLHDQVQVLSSPYLQRLPHNIHEGGGDLRSRGLCLVPVSCTEQMVAGSNGADLWSPAVTMGMGTGLGRSSADSSKN